MTLKEKTINGIPVLTLASPRLDYYLAEDFKQGVADCLGAGHDRLVLNLSEVDFMDSSGLGALVACLKRVGDSRRLVLCQVAPPVLSLFKLTRMDQVFHLFASEQAAVEFLLT